jgi:hypothetical protein
MGRRCFHLLTILCFLLLVSLVTLWLRHYRPFVPHHWYGQQGRGYQQEDRSVEAQLSRRLPELTFDGVGLSDVIDFLRDVSGSNISVEWKELEAAGIDRNQPITLKLKNIQHACALDEILRPANLAFAVDGDFIRISTRDRLRSLSQSVYRPAWPSPSDDNLQAKSTLGVRLEWADRPTPLNRGGHQKGKPPELPPPPNFNYCEDTFTALANATRIPIDGDWPGVGPLGMQRDTRVNSDFNGYSSDWIGLVIRQNLTRRPHPISTSRWPRADRLPRMV